MKTSGISPCRRSLFLKLDHNLIHRIRISALCDPFVTAGDRVRSNLKALATIRAYISLCAILTMTIGKATFATNHQYSKALRRQGLKHCIRLIQLPPFTILFPTIYTLFLTNSPGDFPVSVEETMDSAASPLKGRGGRVIPPAPNTPLEDPRFPSRKP